jgi:hypothetical protein
MDQTHAEVQCVSEVQQAMYSDLLFSNFTATTFYFSAVLRIVSVITNNSSESNNGRSGNSESLSRIFYYSMQLLGSDRNVYFCLSTETLSKPIALFVRFGK